MIHFADEALIEVRSGKGGNGCIAFRREKYVPNGGPNGGDGGRGGDVIFCVKKNLRTLSHLRHKQVFKAKNGSDGEGSNRYGRDGEDVYVPVPPGTTIRDAETGELICEFTTESENETYKFLIGGKGGWGNTHFKSSTNQAPKPLGNKQQRYLSIHDYKRPYYVVYGGNYCMAIYEGVDNRSKTKRSYKILNNLEASFYYNNKMDYYDLVPFSDDNDNPLKCILRAGTMVLLYEDTPNELYECLGAELVKRLYKVKGLCDKKTGNNRTAYITLIHHQEARPDKVLVVKKGVFVQNEDYRPIIELSHNQFNALVEGYDFELTVTGEIKFKR